MNLRPFLFATVLLLLTIFSFGCATTVGFNAVPTEAKDFQRPIDEIRIQYPDIESFERKFRGFLIETPLIGELIGYWGPPDEMKKDWGFYSGTVVGLGSGFILGFNPVSIAETGAIIFAMFPFPPEKYYWIKERYCIEAMVGRKIEVDHPYGRKMYGWTWYEFEKDASSLPKGCRKQKEIAQK